MRIKRLFALLGSLTFIAINAGAQRMEPELFLPCKTALLAGSHWKESGLNYSKLKNHPMPSVDAKRCDMVFLRSTD
jgi:hypothetical protein